MDVEFIHNAGKYSLFGCIFQFTPRFTATLDNRQAFF